MTRKRCLLDGKWLLFSFLLLAIPVHAVVAQNDAATPPSDSNSAPAQLTR